MFRFPIMVFAMCLIASGGYSDTFVKPDASAAEEVGKERSRSQKGLRGVINLSTCWLEIPVQTTRGIRQGAANGETAGVGNKLCGGIFGLSRGVFHGTGRLITGASELVGFWAIDPSSNKGYGTNYDSKFVYQLNVKPSPMDLSSASERMGNKAFRGVSNAVVIPEDFFRYTSRQVCEEKPVSGLSKGIWASSSSLWNSATDIISFPFPNHPDTLGNILE